MCVRVCVRDMWPLEIGQLVSVCHHMGESQCRSVTGVDALAHVFHIYLTVNLCFSFLDNVLPVTFCGVNTACPPNESHSPHHRGYLATTPINDCTSFVIVVIVTKVENERRRK